MASFMNRRSFLRAATAPLVVVRKDELYRALTAEPIDILTV